MDVVLKNNIMLIFSVLTSWTMKKNTILNKYLLDLSDGPLRKYMIWRLICKNMRRIEPNRWVEGWTSLGFTLQWNHHVTLHKKLKYDHDEIIKKCWKLKDTQDVGMGEGLYVLINTYFVYGVQLGSS
jgi:hypothetical protein